MPAMPLHNAIDTVESWDNLTAGGRFIPANGLTKREMFAMHAMQGILSNAGGVIQANSMSGTGWCNCNAHGLVKWSIECADALLAELEK